jgi:hypothetical protein
MHTDRHTEHTLDGTHGPRISSCISAGLMMTMRTVGPPTTRTPCMTRAPGRAHILRRVPFYTVWYAVCRLFSTCVTMFLSIEILIVVGCSIPTFCERDRERVGCAV